MFEFQGTRIFDRLGIPKSPVLGVKTPAWQLAAPALVSILIAVRLPGSLTGRSTTLAYSSRSAAATAMNTGP